MHINMHYVYDAYFHIMTPEGVFAVNTVVNQSVNMFVLNSEQAVRSCQWSAVIMCIFATLFLFLILYFAACTLYRSTRDNVTNRGRSRHGQTGRPPPHPLTKSRGWLWHASSSLSRTQGQLLSLKSLTSGPSFCMDKWTQGFHLHGPSVAPWSGDPAGVPSSDHRYMLALPPPRRWQILYPFLVTNFSTNFWRLWTNGTTRKRS